MQTEWATEEADKQTIHQGITDADGANKAQKTQKRTKHRYRESHKQQ